MKTKTIICPSDRCFKSFCDEESFKKHQLRHAAKLSKLPKKFKCDLCGKSLASKQSLKEHGYKHSNSKPFRCTEIGCAESFRQNSQLLTHCKIHKEAKKLLQTVKVRSFPSPTFFAERLSAFFQLEEKVLPVASKVPVSDLILPKINP
jgi:uncharacterized Zn-finger protein